MQPTIAPDAEQTCVQPLAEGSWPPVNLSAQVGAHCMEPQLPKRATPLNAAARSIRRTVLLMNSVVSGNNTGLLSINNGNIVSFQNNNLLGNFATNPPTATQAGQ